MAVFVPGKAVTTTDSHIEVTVAATAPLAPGQHRFQLVVVDDAGNESQPTIADVVVVDDQRPTAVLDVPARVSLGASFTLSGARSSDVAPGKVAQYRWTQLT